MNRLILHERTYRGSMLKPEIDLCSTENARKRQNGKLSAWGSHLGHWGELRRRGLISGRGELELGTSWNGDDERRRAAAVPPGDPVTRERREIGEMGPGRRRTREQEVMAATAAYWNKRKNCDDPG